MVKHAASVMIVVLSNRLSGADLNHLSLLSLKGWVASERKRGEITLQVRTRKMSETKPLLKGRKIIEDIKTNGSPKRWDKHRRNLITDLCGVRLIGGMSLVQALVWNVGTCRFDAKGNIQVAKTMRVKVPMRSTGAEQPVVVMKSAKADGAKGLCYLCFIFGSTVIIGGI